ncbi:membrane protein [Halomonas sp. A020]|uniref:T6SS effector BTH_I2691 family protein n=1 Tax=Halomonas sp. A020 TaxID=2717374 RepID=UPI0024925950|nr:T6SS effector BTH_I2691 family protein [Halomonas sp. A020]BCB59896.1 membrane protein [Halomonas sp. A020]
MDNTDAQARNAAFDETPIGGGVCPLLLDVTLFPVRYAIDEAPEQAGAPHPHPLSEQWQGPGYPAIHTRGYTLRQLRDGWLYVWVEEDGEQRIDEYVVEGATFNGEPHLTYSTCNAIALAYSPMQWTERIREHMLENAEARQRTMRSVNLMSAISDTADGTSLSAHVGPLTQLAEHVADITPNGAVEGFTSTTVSTIERAETADASDGDGDEEGVYPLLAVKPEITQDSVLAAVDNHDEALFVALDDDLGIVNDLTMALVGRQLELEAFLEEHGHQLEIAQVVKALCLIDIDDLISDDVRQDPERYRDIMLKTGELLDAMKNVTNGSDHTLLRREQRVTQLREELVELGMPTPPGRHSPLYEEWHGKELPRLDVRSEEAIAFLAEKAPQLERLHTHIDNSLADFTVWLERLPLSAQSLCFDTVDAEQNRAMHEWGCMVVEVLGATQVGRAWLDDTFHNRDSLISVAMSNFDPALAEALDTIARHFIAQGTEDGQPADSGVTATGVVSQANAALGVLSLEEVQRHPAYQALAPHVQEAFDTLRSEVSSASKKLWETIGYQFLPSLSAKGQVSMEKAARALVHSMMVVMVHPDVAATDITIDLDYEARHREWREQAWRLTGEIRTEELRSRREGQSAQQRTASSQRLEALEQQRYEHAFNEPKRVTANEGAGGGIDQSAAGNQTRASNLSSAGYYELREQHRVKLTSGASAARRHMASRVEQLGGGLALLIAGLNLYNFIDAARTAQKEGVDEEGMRQLAATTGAATVAVMSLWVMPFWNRAAKRSFRFNGNMIRLTDVSIGEWQSNGRQAASRIAARLATRMAGLSAIGAIAAGLDMWQTNKDLREATSVIERNALNVKRAASLAMTITGVAQVGGAALGRWFAFSWILGPKVAVVLLAAGVIHLIASHFAARYNREGVRGWLYTSTWGNGELAWEASDEGHKSEWQALMEILLQPTVKLTSVTDLEFDSSNMSYYGTGKMSRTYQGCWVQIAFPAVLAGETVKLSENARGGFWAPASSYEQSPTQQGERGAVLPADAGYDTGDVRVWQAWIPASEQAEREPFVMTVNYAETLLASSESSLGFTFYKPNAARGKKEIEPNSEEGQGINLPARFDITVPMSLEE